MAQIYDGKNKKPNYIKNFCQRFCQQIRKKLRV